MKKELKQLFLQARNGSFITPLIEQAMELVAKSLPEAEWCECIGNCKHEEHTKGANQMLAEVKAKLGLEDNGCSFCGEYKTNCLCSK